MTDQTARMRQLADTLNQASQAYYFGSEPIMSDMDWDSSTTNCRRWKRKRASSCRIPRRTGSAVK